MNDPLLIQNIKFSVVLTIFLRGLRDEQNRYAFYRGKTPLGNVAPRKQPQSNPKPIKKGSKGLNYQQNLQFQNEAIQGSNWKNYDQLRRGKNRGGQIQQVK